MKNVNRRNFLGGFGAAASCSLIGDPALCQNSTAEPDCTHCRSIINPYQPGAAIAGGGGASPRDVKINVKPVYYALIHSGVWEGPCRYTGGGPGPEAERAQNRNAFNRWVANFKKTLPPDATMLDPVYYEFPEFVKITRADLTQLEADKDQVDLYVVTGTNLSQYLASVIGEIYKRPVDHRHRDNTAYLRSRGLEGYHANDYDGGFTELVSLLRARKAFQQMKMLLITNIGIPGYPVTSAVRDFQDLKNRFGIGAVVISFQELSDERDRILADKDSMEAVQGVTDALCRNAQAVHMDRKMLMGDILVYQSVKNLMRKHNCNAFSIECFEWCGSRQPDRWKANPCLTHSLNIDEGYPSACEGDLCALLAQSLLMAVAKRSAYIGNCNVTAQGRKRDWDTERWVDGADRQGEKLWVGHNVPGRKMLGFGGPELPYEIRDFIAPKENVPGWGGSLKIDLTQIRERAVTIGRFNPLATRVLVTKGEVIGMRGFDTRGCSFGAIMNVEDPTGFTRKCSNYGTHFALVYGDWTRELRHVAEMLKIDIEFHNV